MFMVMALSGHSSTRMLERYVHPTDTRKLDALTLGGHILDTTTPATESPATDVDDCLKDFGGRRGARTRDLRVANAALSQLS